MILDCQIRCPNYVKDGMVEFVFIKKRFIVIEKPTFFERGERMLYCCFDDVYDMVTMDESIKVTHTTNIIYKIDLELDTLKYYGNK
jgi:hypothetical protein